MLLTSLQHAHICCPTAVLMKPAGLAPHLEAAGSPAKVGTNAS
jgi:hypothetical protein